MEMKMEERMDFFRVDRKLIKLILLFSFVLCMSFNGTLDVFITIFREPYVFWLILMILSVLAVAILVGWNIVSDENEIKEQAEMRIEKPLSRKFIIAMTICVIVFGISLICFIATLCSQSFR